MSGRLWIVFGLAVVALFSGASHAESAWVTKDEYASVVVLVDDTASDADKAAAKEFVEYWKKVTGHGALMTKKPLRNTGINVWIGRVGAPEELLGAVSMEGLGADGFCIRSFKAKKRAPAHLLIAGGKERGTMYGVFQFLEDYLGVRYLTPDLTLYPKKAPASLPEINVRYTPQIVRRQLTYGGYGMQGVPEDQRKAFEQHMRWSPYPDFGLFVHTAFTLLPPDKYFAEHPDFYSEIGGKRVAPVGVDLGNPQAVEQHADLRSQLCFSNPHVAEAIVEELRPRMQAAPDKQIWSVSQMDWDARCQCAQCREIDVREGTPMGSILTCVNRVADALKTEFPDRYIETLAYTWSRKPPKTIMPRENVIISLCAIECDYARPIFDKTSTLNSAFAEDLAGWGRITNNLFLWDYPANCRFAQAPYPDFDTLGPNYRFFAENNVKGVFACGGDLLMNDLGALRCYVLSRLMWQPNSDAKALIDEFIDQYYAEAAPFIRQYIELMTRTLHVKGTVMDCFDRCSWINADTVAQAEEIFKQALAAAQTDPVKQKLEDVYSSVRYAAIISAPKAEAVDAKFVLTRPPCMTVEDYIKHIESRGFKVFEAGKALADFVMERTGKTAPPRSEESPIETLENENYLVWIVPAIKGSIIRWQDKHTGTEWLKGYQRYGAGPSTWQDWTDAHGAAEGPAADVYEVAERTPESVTLRATRPDGLVIERTMALKAGSEAFDVLLTVSNPTDKPLIGNVKIHPEFFAQGTTAPEIYAQRAGFWLRQGESSGARNLVASAFLEPDGYTGLAISIPNQRLSLACTFEAKDLGGLFWFYNVSPEAQQCNLELLPPKEPLQPGEKRTIYGTYASSKGKLPGM